MSFIHFPIKITVGAIAGVIAGFVFALIAHAVFQDGTYSASDSIVGLMLAEKDPTPMTAQGWIYHLFGSASVGGVIGWFFGERMQNYRSAVAYGLVAALISWMIGSFLIMPATFETYPSAFFPIIAKALVAHLLGGLMFAVSFVWLIKHAHISDVSAPIVR